MKLKNPSPKVLAFLIIVVILTTVTIVSSKLFKYVQKPDNSEMVNLIIKNNLNKKLDTKDTDGDGLPDWQEEIWGSDKNNPDTDGDGTTDGKEVNENRNPTVAGPDDKILSDREIALQYVPGETDPKSVTSILSKNLLLRMAQLQQSGQYNDQTSEELATGLVDQTLSEIQIPDK